MDYHHHARLTIYRREHLAKSVVEGLLSLRQAAAECGLSRQSAAKWVQRYREQGRAGLANRSWLDETGAPMKVQQELMRHASIQTTMNIYGRAMSSSKREANGKVVEMVLKPVRASA